jgi:anti-sigma regulatory factor (Ser/Thr protein kinase)
VAYRKLQVRRENTQLGTRSQPGLLHEALVVDGDETFVSRVAPFLRAGLCEGPTVAVLSRRHWALLREELGADAERVSFTDCDDFYIRPIDALASYDATLRRLTAAGSTSVRVAGEIPLGPTRSGWDDWISYEAVLNHAFADRPAHVLCVYDARIAPDAVIDAVWRTHPHVVGRGDEIGPHYHDPHDIVAALTPRPREIPLRSLTPTQDAIAFREELSAELTGAGAPRAQVVNMLVAANEVFENALKHGSGPTALRAGLVEGWFACEIEDSGPGLDDPLAGYVPPTPERPGGAGLWIARQLVSRLELIPRQPGLTVRLWL